MEVFSLLWYNLWCRFREKEAACNAGKDTNYDL